MPSDPVSILAKLFARFNDDNEAEALSAFQRFRHLCRKSNINVSDLTFTLRASQFPVDEYKRLLDSLRSPVHARIAELEAQLRKRDAQIARLRAKSRPKRKRNAV